jgi:hypothetical protein
MKNPKNKFEIQEFEIIPEMIHLVVLDYTDEDMPKVVFCDEIERAKSMAGEILNYKSKGL